MKVEHGVVVTLTYDITSEGGEIIESSDLSGPITFVHGKSGMIPGLDKRLEGMTRGQEDTFEFAPEEAFGTVESAPSRSMARAEFPADTKFEVGEFFEAGAGNGQTIRLRVADVPDDKTVVVQIVHPLAGQTIGMSVKVLELRKATAAETASGKVMTTPPPPPPPGK